MASFERIGTSFMERWYVRWVLKNGYDWKQWRKKFLRKAMHRSTEVAFSSIPIFNPLSSVAQHFIFPLISTALPCLSTPPLSNISCPICVFLVSSLKPYFYCTYLNWQLVCMVGMTFLISNSEKWSDSGHFLGCLPTAYW